MANPEVNRPVGEEAAVPDPFGTSEAGRWVAVLAGLAVALLVGLLSVPSALAIWMLSPDAVEHLAIAQSWLHGAGFVDPLKWYWYLNTSVVQPAFAVRAPVVPALLALPLGLGASISVTAAVHAVWASLIAGATVLVAARFMRLPAAMGAALLFVLSPAWIFVSHLLWTEATAWGTCLLVFVTSRGVVRSVRGGLICATATALAMLTRPNLGVLAVAVILTAILELGPRTALRNRSLWSYVIGLTLIYKGVGVWIQYTNGEALYSGYGAWTENISDSDMNSYQKVYMGTWFFIQLHATEIMDVMAARLGQLYGALCLKPMYHYVGWLMLPGALYGLLFRGPGSLERRVTALCALGFSAVVVATYPGYEEFRYPLLGAGSAALCGLAMLDSFAHRLERRFSVSRSRVFGLFLRSTPLLLVILLVLGFSAGTSASGSLHDWRQWRQYGTNEYSSDLDADIRILCKHMDRDAVVSSAWPWTYFLWCGNAGVRLPKDIASLRWQQQFIKENQPQYFVWDGDPESSWLRNTPLVREIAKSGSLILYEVTRSMPGSKPWIAPPPLACAGKDPSCARALGR